MQLDTSDGMSLTVQRSGKAEERGERPDRCGLFRFDRKKNRPKFVNLKNMKLNFSRLQAAKLNAARLARMPGEIV